VSGGLEICYSNGVVSETSGVTTTVRNGSAVCYTYVAASSVVPFYDPQGTLVGTIAYAGANSAAACAGQTFTPYTPPVPGAACTGEATCN
jgi:hypothetical protein